MGLMYLRRCVGKQPCAKQVVLHNMRFQTNTEVQGHGWSECVKASSFDSALHVGYGES